MRREDLDDQQRLVLDAVVGSDSKILVLGGPGTGKTTTALWAARNFLQSSDSAPRGRVLFLTFSRSAVSQILNRSPGVISGFESKVEILTFHALAYRLIRAFGRYAGYGQASPSIQSEARAKLLGQDRSQLRYQDLVSGAITMLERSCRIRALIQSRWGLVICDEVQDTNTEQWNLLQILGSGKVLLLGDANQMIYTFIPGVSRAQFDRVRRWADQEIELRPQSHRDPSGAIPALAEAVRTRQFDHAAVTEAFRTGRLVIHTEVEHAQQRHLLTEEIKHARALGARDVGIFAHSNQAVAELAHELENAGIDHVLIGIPEAHAEALVAMANQCMYAVGLTSSEEVWTSLAVFLTATVRSTSPPALANGLIGEGSLPAPIRHALAELERALRSAAIGGTVEEVATIAMGSWQGLGITAGFRPWSRAASHFRRLAFPFRSERVSAEVVSQLVAVVEKSRIEALIDLDYSEKGRVKLMNYHQTKGREADTVIHVFRSDDYFGREIEPFETASRLLHVAISRARQRVIVVLPPNPHPLVEPFNAIKEQRRERR